MESIVRCKTTACFTLTMVWAACGLAGSATGQVGRNRRPAEATKPGPPAPKSADVKEGDPEAITVVRYRHLRGEAILAMRFLDGHLAVPFNYAIRTVGDPFEPDAQAEIRVRTNRKGHEAARSALDLLSTAPHQPQMFFIDMEGNPVKASAVEQKERRVEYVVPAAKIKPLARFLGQSKFPLRTGMKGTTLIVEADEKTHRCVAPIVEGLKAPK